ncbi:MAG: hypothetical protein GYB33_08035 [Gammaproteobacteria bacterium]|nr:hypothetical protein [Gammaproteobacteria bacterium]
MIALIAMQSLMAVADVHQLHQSGTEQLTLEHDHDQILDNPQAEREIQSNGPMGGTSLDCHHCCHCHSIAHFFLGSTPDSIPEVDLGSSHSGYQLHYSSYLGAPENPPPIN